MSIRHPSSSATTRLLASSTLALALLFAGDRAAAQGVPAGGQPSAAAGGQASPTLRGVVVDSLTGEPIETATVEVLELDKMTVARKDGTFELRRLRPGSYVVSFRVLGYRQHRRFVQLRGEVDLGRVALVPEPVMLEALKVTYSELESRRRAAPVAVRTLNRRYLATTASSDAAQLVRTHFGLSPTRCAYYTTVYATPGDGGCGFIRGSVSEIAVFIDERPAIGGMEELELYDPSDFHTVEIYGGGRMIRAYTMWYMENMARRRAVPQPIVW